jgi:hypothetical protein
VQPPSTRYVDRDGVSIAYQVVGDGPIDVLLSPGNISHLDLQWADPWFTSFLTRLASFSRLITRSHIPASDWGRWSETAGRMLDG